MFPPAQPPSTTPSEAATGPPLASPPEPQTSAPPAVKGYRMRHIVPCLVLLLSVPALRAAADGTTDTSSSPHARLTGAGLTEARWTGGLMGERFDTCRT